MSDCIGRFAQKVIDSQSKGDATYALLSYEYGYALARMVKEAVAALRVYSGEGCDNTLSFYVNRIVTDKGVKAREALARIEDLLPKE